MTPSSTLAPAPPSVPSVARGVELVGQMPGSGYRRPPRLVRRADGQAIHLTPLLFSVLEAIDGRRDHARIADEVAAGSGRLLTGDEVAYLVEEKLRPLGLVTDRHGGEPVVERTNPLLALRLRFVVSNPALTNRLTAPFALLFHPAVVAPALAAFAWVTAWVLLDKGLGAPLHNALYEPRSLLLVFALTALSAGFHEFGHAAACRYGGATPGAMGAALYLVWPAFYTDVSDSYRLGRAGRLRVDVGGLYFNAIFAVGVFGAWALTRSDALLVMVPVQLFQMVRQLLPLVRFDGYHILADLTGVPDLFAHVRPTLRGLLPRHWGDPGTKVLKPWARAVVTAWVAVTVPALAAFLVMLVLLLPRIVATAADSLRLQYAVLQGNVADGALADVAARLLSLLAIALPPLSIAYLLARIARATSVRAWRAAEDHPHGRRAVTTALATVAAFAMMALWPGGQYAPVQAGERAAAADGFGVIAAPLLGGVPPAAAADRQSPEPADMAAMRRAAAEPAPTGTAAGGRVPRPATAGAGPAGQPGDAPAPPPGTGDSAPPAAGTGRAAWPFPFAPPPEPGAGDNFAVAVNTVDSSHVSDVQTSLLWLDDARIDQRNRSYALASCAGCTATATAFQVIVAHGSPTTVVPENAAVAVNFECTTCVTHSIAVQLVVTTKQTPPDDVRRRVESRFAVAEALEAGAPQIRTAELRSRLLAVKAEIIEILEPYTDEATTATDADGDGAAADSVPSPAAPTTTTSPTPEAASTATSTTSTSPTSEPAPPASTSTTTTGAESSTTTEASTTTTSDGSPTTTTAPATTTTTSDGSSTTTGSSTATTTTTSTTTTAPAPAGDPEPTTTTTEAPP